MHARQSPRRHNRRYHNALQQSALIHFIKIHLRQWAHIIAPLLFLSLSFTARPDTIVSLLTVGPGDEFFQLHGHALLRIATQRTDSVYSFETDPQRSAVVQYFAGNRGSILSAAAPHFIDSIKASGRGLNAYTLNLYPAEKQLLIRALRNAKGRSSDKFNVRTANCTTRLFDLIDSAITPQRLSPGTAPCYTLPAARFYTDTLRAASPWTAAIITLALGTAADDSITDSRQISPLLFDAHHSYFTIDSTRPMVSSATTILPRTRHTPVTRFNPTWAAILLAIIILAPAFLRARGLLPRLCRALDMVSLGIIFICGSLIAFATFTPYSVGSGQSLTLTVLCPLIIFLPALHNARPRILRTVTYLWAAWLLTYTIFAPNITCETIPALRIIAAALTLRLITHTSPA